MNTQADSSEQIVKAALDLAAERGWRTLTMTEIAARAGISLDELYWRTPGKPAILAAFDQMIDRAVLAGGSADPADKPRDRLFEVMMRRFDALSEYRAGVAALIRDLPADPVSALAELPRLNTAMQWTLEAAGIPATGLIGRLKVQALGVVYLLVLRVWLDDDSEDQSRTMAALDKRLQQAEQLANTFDRSPRRAAAPPESGATRTYPAATATAEPGTTGEGI